MLVRRTPSWIPLMVAYFALVLAGCVPGGQVPAPPVTEVHTVSETMHDTEITDDYRWLEDQESQETRAWIDAQNAYTDSLLSGLPGRAAIREQVSRLLKVDSVGQPQVVKGLLFYRKRGASDDQPKIYVRDGADGEERLLLDPAEFAPDLSKSVDIVDIADDASLVAYSIREKGEDEVEYRFREVASGQDLETRLPKATYFGLSFAPGARSFFYTCFGEDGPRVYERVMGSTPESARLIFGEGYTRKNIIYASIGQDGHFLLIHVLEGSSSEKTEVWVQDLRSRAKGGLFLVTGGLAADFRADAAGGRIYMRTNHEAPNGKIVVFDPRRRGTQAFQDIVPQREGAILSGFSLVGGRLIVNYLEDVQSRVRVFDLDGLQLGEIRFDTLGTVSGVSGSWKGDEAFFSFSSLHMPSTVYRYDLATEEQVVWFQPELPIDPDAFEVKQVWFPSKDGTKVPMFLLYKKGLELNGKNPTLLYGYGGFKVSLQPRFMGLGAAWAEMGGVFALANLRGGGEFGESWHQAGMLERKQNSFDDFYAAAEWLIAEGYTSSEHLAARGGSNGGLLVGVALTQHPELFEAIVCVYPLLDMLRYDKFLVAKFWVPEYGSADSAEQFPFIYAYSPYQHVKQGVDYPATLFITGDGDTRVAPLHARKMTALVQAKSALRRPVMLRYHADQGHSGGTPVSQRIEDMVEVLSFLKWRL